MNDAHRNGGGPPEGAAAPWGSPWVARAALVLVAAAFLLHARLYWSYTVDDAYITFRYSRMLALGHGPYFNPGEHVEGYTTFLWMLVVAPVIRLFGAGAAAPFAKVLGALCGAASALLAYGLSRSIARAASGWSLLAAGIVAVHAGFVLNSVNAMETALFSLLLTWGVLAATLELRDRRWRGSGPVFAAAVLTRPEAAPIFAVCWAAQAALALRALAARREAGIREAFVADLRSRGTTRVLLVNLAIVLVVFAAHLAFRFLAYDHELLPNTYHAKAGGFWKTGAWPYISEGVLGGVFGVVGTGLALAGFARGRRDAALFLPAAAVALAGTFLPYVTGTDWMEGGRLVVPYLPLLACTVVGGWRMLLAGRLGSRPWVAVAVAAVCLAALWVAGSEEREALRSRIGLRAEGYETGHRALARWVRAGAVPEGGSIALMDIGLIGYECIDRRILDISGLTDRFIAKSEGPFLRKSYDPAYVVDRRPDLVVLVMAGPGGPYAPPPPGARFKFWTGVEQRIYDHPGFRSGYVNRREGEYDPSRWLESLAAWVGAERVFPHAHPGGRYYLLAAFRRRA